ncbi:MAG: hypothetical protein S4CHLAM102_00790 [Chlamydiia bacterium]|nr:hypothetical protein [Chlamydiia bacterium]
MVSSREITPKEINSELKRIWADHKEGDRTPASLFNLVVHARHDRREAYIQKVVRNVIRRFPCRIIFVVETEPTTNDFIKTTVTDLKADETENSVFCEMITFEVTPNYRERIPFLIEPNLIPDLPVYLLWGDNPKVKDPLSFKLENLATRTIFDSEVTNTVVEFSHSILELQKAAKCEIADLNWARMEDWRQLFALTFNCKEQIECLTSAQSLSISFNNSESECFCHNQIQATYLQAWIATSLGWEFVSNKWEKGVPKYIYSHNQKNIEVSLIPGSHPDLHPGRILSVDITTCDQTTYAFTRKEGHPHVAMIHKASQAACELPTFHLLDREKSGRALVREIYHQGTSEHFNNVLNLIKNYTEGPTCHD